MVKKGTALQAAEKVGFGRVSYQGTASAAPQRVENRTWALAPAVVPNAWKDFFSSLFSRAAEVFYFCHSERTLVREKSVVRLFQSSQPGECLPFSS
jgi:hypothetical protein